MVGRRLGFRRLESVGGKEAAGDELLGELDLAGGELGGGDLGKRPVKELVVEELVGDLGKAIGGEDGDGKGKAVLGVVIVLGHRDRSPLAELHLALEAGDAKVLGDMKIIEQDFLEGGLGFGGRVVSIPAKLIEEFLCRGLGVVSPGQPKENKVKLPLHFHGCFQGVEGGWLEKPLQVFLGDLHPLHFAHAFGGGHGVKNQVVVRREVVSPAKKVVILVIGLLQESRKRSRRSSRHPRTTPEEQKQGEPDHSGILREGRGSKSR